MNIEMIEQTEAAIQTALAIRGNIEKVESALTEFEKISDGLAALAARYPHDLAYDVTTSKGMAEAVAHRAAWREPRILVEKYRTTAKAPVLALGKDIDARAAWITEQLELGEKPVHAQIKAEEDRKKAEKQARIEAEFGRVQAIEEALAEIHMEVMAASGKPSAVIAAKLEALRLAVPAAAVFQEKLDQAKIAHAMALGKLEQALKAQLFTEAEIAKLAADRLELEQLRAAANAQKVKDEAAAAEARKAEDARIAAERKAAEAELSAQRAVQAAEAEALKEAAAALVKQQAEFAEAQRKAAVPPPAAISQPPQPAAEAPAPAPNPVAPAAALAPAIYAPLRDVPKRLYFAVIDCEHTIDIDKIVLYRDPELPGNALHQLGVRLDAANPT